MKILIDAYNVLKQNTSGQFIEESQRQVFIKRLGDYAKKRGHEIIVVFDGGDATYPHMTRHDLVSVVFSGNKMSADDVLKRFCIQNKTMGIILVSSDRQLCAYAHSHGIVCIDSNLLFDILDGAQQVAQVKVVKGRGDAQKRPGHDSSVELDALMQQGSLQMLVKTDDAGVSKRKDARTLSKAEKKLKRLVNKL